MWDADAYIGALKKRSPMRPTHRYAVTLTDLQGDGD